MGCSRNIKKCSNEGDKLLILYGVEGYRYRWTGKESLEGAPCISSVLWITIDYFLASYYTKKYLLAYAANLSL